MFNNIILWLTSTSNFPFNRISSSRNEYLTFVTLLFNSVPVIFFISLESVLIDFDYYYVIILLYN
jgi:hypothetical protein